MSDGGSEDLGVLVAGCRQPDSPHSEGPRGCRSSEPPRQSWPVCSVGKRNGLRFRSRSRQITQVLFESGGFQRDDAAGGSRPPWASRQPPVSQVTPHDPFGCKALLEGRSRRKRCDRSGNPINGACARNLCGTHLPSGNSRSAIRPPSTRPRCISSTRPSTPSPSCEVPRQLPVLALRMVGTCGRVLQQSNARRCHGHAGVVCERLAGVSSRPLPPADRRARPAERRPVEPDRRPPSWPSRRVT